MRYRTKHIAALAGISLFLMVECLLNWAALLEGISPGLRLCFSLLRPILYIGFFVLWGISVYRRILQKQVRRYMITFAGLTVFWMLIRTMKFEAAVSVTFERYLWYLYGIPILFIPFFGMLTAFSLGKSENYSLPRWICWLYLPPLGLVLLVLSNDFHQLVFRFLIDLHHLEIHQYTHGPGYYAVLLWIGICTLIMMLALFRNSRIPDNGKRILYPLLPITATGIYLLLFLLRPEALWIFSEDIATYFCLLSLATMESCLSTHLIPTNTRYEELLHLSVSAMYITDREEHLLISSDLTKIYSREILHAAVESPLMLGSNIRLCSVPIQNGRVFWTEDMSELNETVHRLTEIDSFLQSRRAMVEKEYRSRRRRQRGIEKKRLYNSVMQQTEETVGQYMSLVQSLEEETDPEEIRRIVLRITVICAYIKRRISLIFHAKENGTVSSELLNLCICKDSLPCICQCGATAGYSSVFHGMIAIQTAMTLYRAFHVITMEALDSLELIDIRFDQEGNVPALFLRLVCDRDLSGLACPEIRVSGHGREWELTVMEKGGCDEAMGQKTVD